MVHKWDLSELVEEQRQSAGKELDYDWSNAVLNGIAYSEARDSVVLFGKMWDWVFEVQLNYADFM